tara:strand:+ start:1164 stop:1793 length:630 start_codon:yes stop_codon:yes gene_type:complete
MKKNKKFSIDYTWSDDTHHTPSIVSNIQKLLTGINTKKLDHLDLGCGNGFITKKIYHFFDTSLGIDLSQDGIKFARKKLKSKQISFKHQSAEQLFKQKKKFGFITSIEVIEHQYDPYKFMKDIEKISKKGAYILITTPFHGYIKNLAISILGKMDPHYGPLWQHGHIKFFSVKTLTQLISLYKFKIIDIKYSGRFYPLSSSMMFLLKRN